MASTKPTLLTPWEPLTAPAIAALFSETPARWWLSGGVALDHWLGRRIRERSNSDISTTSGDLARILASLQPSLSAWIPLGDDGESVPFTGAPMDVDPQPVLVHDDVKGVWVLQVNIEDAVDGAWVYKRDPRLQLPWNHAVLDVDGVPTGAPEVQLVWKALRPRPEDEVDRDAVLLALSDDARAWYERCILSIHPHSSWSIRVRSPFAPAKASWNRKTR